MRSKYLYQTRMLYREALTIQRGRRQGLVLQLTGKEISKKVLVSIHKAKQQRIVKLEWSGGNPFRELKCLSEAVVKDEVRGPRLFKPCRLTKVFILVFVLIPGRWKMTFELLGFLPCVCMYVCIHVCYTRTLGHAKYVNEVLYTEYRVRCLWILSHIVPGWLLGVGN